MQVTKSGSRHGISNLSFKDCEEEHRGKIFASLKKHPVQHPVTSKILEVRNIYSPSDCRCTKWIEETALAQIITVTQIHIHFIVVKYITKDRFSRHHIIQYYTISHGFYWHLLTLWQARKAAGARASQELCATLGVRNDQTISNDINRAKCVGHFMLQDGAFGSSWSDVSARVITKSRVFPACCSSKCACLFLFGSFLEKSNVKLSLFGLFNLFMMLAIWPLLLGVVRSEAGRTLPGIKWAQSVVASLITKATCYSMLQHHLSLFS